MKKNKRKRKSKNKPSCPYGDEYGFGYSFGEYPKCKNCSLYEKCKTAYNKLVEDELIINEDKEALPQKQKSKKAKKRKKKQDHRGAYIPSPALNKLLRLTNHFCVKLYLSYMEVGIIQKTNQPWCNNNYMAKRLKWDKDTVRKYKNQLVKTGYITIIRERNKQGRLGKSYIKLKYFPSKRVIEKVEFLRQLDEVKRQYEIMLKADLDLVTSLATGEDKARQRAKKWKQKYKKLKLKQNQH